MVSKADIIGTWLMVDRGTNDPADAEASLARYGSQPGYCTYKNDKGKAFVRYGSSTVEPPANEWVRWTSEKFKTGAHVSD